MRLFISAKILFTLIFLSLTFAGCGGSETDRNTENAKILEFNTGLPFSSIEPQVYQADAIITFGDSERKIHIARKNEKRRIDYDTGTDGETAVIVSEKKFVASSRLKIFAEMPDDGSFPAGPLDDLAQNLLNISHDTKFEEISTENNITKYRVLNGDETASEVFIYADTELGMPIKTEHFSLTGGGRKLLFSFELQNVSRDVDDDVFKPAKEWKSISFKELFEAMTVGSTHNKP